MPCFFKMYDFLFCDAYVYGDYLMLVPAISILKRTSNHLAFLWLQYCMWRAVLGQCLCFAEPYPLVISLA